MVWDPSQWSAWVQTESLLMRLPAERLVEDSVAQNLQTPDTSQDTKEDLISFNLIKLYRETTDDVYLMPEESYQDKFLDKCLLMTTSFHTENPDIWVVTHSMNANCKGKKKVCKIPRPSMSSRVSMPHSKA